MSQPITFKDIRLTNAVKLKETFDTVDYAKTRYFVDVDMKNTYEIEGQNKSFVDCPQNKKKKPRFFHRICAFLNAKCLKYS